MTVTVPAMATKGMAKATAHAVVNTGRRVDVRFIVSSAASCWCGMYRTKAFGAVLWVVKVCDCARGLFQLEKRMTRANYVARRHVRRHQVRHITPSAAHKAIAAKLNH